MVMPIAIAAAPSSAQPFSRLGRGQRVVLWTLQSFLALVFLAHGVMMLVPPAEVAAQMNAVLPRWFQLFIGVAEVLAVIGLTLPPLTRRLLWLVPMAAAGIMIVMISAAILHTTRGEFSSALTTLVLLAIAAVVANVRYNEYRTR